VVNDLEGGGNVVDSVAMFELGVEFLVNPITKVGSDSLEEALANVPACLHISRPSSLRLRVWAGVMLSMVGS
jgi:hypothetical protein